MLREDVACHAVDVMQKPNLFVRQLTGNFSPSDLAVASCGHTGLQNRLLWHAAEQSLAAHDWIRSRGVALDTGPADLACDSWQAQTNQHHPWACGVG